jgi:hypothetical protein
VHKLLQVIWLIAKFLDIFTGAWDKYRKKRDEGSLPQPQNGEQP